MAMLSIKDFPDDVYKSLKIRAVKEGKTLRDLTIEILTKAVKGKEV
ncbi:MAG: 3-hydroxyacyl-CoA dehydrogenase [Nitrospinae bacterium]|nr:3-hydroxyacyl-CoA dehydrogenase [Nitrospinota bacterium]